MRPHTLTFGGIGAYAGTVEIDFDELSSLGLYLIVGPTGAGKTTIFDAMTYALFGKVAGERPVSGIISDHSHRVSPSVTLEFSHGDFRYSVHRVPTLEGKQAKTGDHAITKRDESGTVIETVTGQKKVSEYVTELIGLQADQFMKVILLPQNEFQKFLLANSTDKMPLLRALFGTHLYESIAFKLENAASALYAQAKEAAHDVSSLRTQFSDIVKDLVDNDFLNYPLDEFPDHDTVIADVTSLSQTLHQEAATALAAFGSAQANFTMGSAEQQRFDAAKRREELRHILAESEEATNAARAALSAHQRAIPVSTHATTVDQARVACDASASRLAEARQQLTILLDALEPTESLVAPLRNLTPDTDPSVISQEIYRATETLSQVRATFAEIDSLTTRITHIESELATSENQIQILISEREKSVAEIAEVHSQRDLARDAEITVVELSHKAAAIDDLLARAEVETARATLVATQHDFDTVSAALAEAESALTDARRHHTQHLAGDLAQQLIAAEPCPVCGSTEHPRPAPLTADVDVATLEKNRDALLTTRAARESVLTTAQQDLEKATAAFESLPTAEEQAQLRHDLAEAEKRVASISALSKAALTLESRIAALDTDISVHTQKVSALKSELTTRRSHAETLRSQIATVVSREQIDSIAQTLSQIGTINHDLTDAAAQLMRDTATYESSTTVLTSLLQASEFATLDDALTAVLDDAHFTTFNDLVTKSQRHRDEILTLDGVIGDSPVPDKRPNVDVLQNLLDEALTANNVASQRNGVIENRLNQLITLRDSLAGQAGNADALHTRATNALNVAKVVKAGTGVSLSLERWVQRQLFEEVCDVASVQIAALTSNKHQLTLNSDGARSAKKTAGLDIFVIDSHTGKTRSVSSLSGGEQFLTSLALSLALAEVVQRHSGGVEISTLFIDEGFGSLDGDSLDLAVDVLRSLQDSGRTVGVISHVESMQQELHVGIRVSSSPTGSSLQVFA